MRRFVVIGQRATSSPDFSLIDIPGTSGRLDVLLRCLRAALLVSHGLRRDTIVYLVLLGGEARSLRFDGAASKYVRPDERSLATSVKKALAIAPNESTFSIVRPGIACARGGLDTVLDDLGPSSLYVLEEGATDLRATEIEAENPVFFVGDHLGFDSETRARLALLVAKPIGIGPTSVHAEDAITIVCNELDRRFATSSG